jgi:ankyrin repeat protein
MNRILCFLLLIIISSCNRHDKERWDDEKEYWSPLMYAIYDNDIEEFTDLINQKADVNFIAKGDNTSWKLSALDIALFMNNDVAAEKLLSTGKIRNPNDYIIGAAAEDNARNVQLLVNYGADPNKSLDNGYNALMSATSFGSIEVLECLLKNKANPNSIRNIDGATPLKFAKYNKDSVKEKLLIKYGAKK